MHSPRISRLLSLCPLPNLANPTPLSVPIIVFVLVSLFAPGVTLAQQTRNVTLLSHLNPYTEYTNSWAYIHPDGREYVALGTRFGTSIVRLADPSNPVEVGFIPAAGCGTRDIDQYQTFLYVVAGLCRTGDPGIQIISMADPDNPVLVNTVHGLVETAENITIDPVRALLYTSETNQNQGINNGLHILSLTDPVNPAQIAAYDGYEIHDFTFQGARGFAGGIDTGTLHVLDVSIPSSPTDITSFSTGGGTHSAWPTTDGRYLYVTNENFFAPYGEVRVYDLANLSRPTLLYTSNLIPGATAHYPRVQGNRLHLAYYSAGARIWDVSNPAWPAEVGYYDTWTGDDRILAGVYDTCPYYPSGIFTATDRSGGLYVFRLNGEYGIVRGTVLDGNNARTPLPGATVRAVPEGLATTTGADGRYAIAPAPGGAVTIEVTKYGYMTQSSVLSVSSGSDQTLDFTFSKLPTGAIKGTVTQALDGSPVTAADVAGVDTPLATTTSLRGVYSLMKVPEGPITLRAERSGLIPAAATVTIVSRNTSTVDFALQATPFYDDAETDRGWILGDADDDATAGRWVRAVPVGTTNGADQAQPSEDHTPAPGTMCFVTGNGVANGSPFDADVDGGKTTLTSPVLTLTSVADPRIVYWRWYYNNNTIAGPQANPFITDISNDGGVTWTRVDSIQAAHNSWERVELRVTDYFPSPGNVCVRFIARDLLSAASIVEAGIDDFEYYSGAALGVGTLAVSSSTGEATIPMLQLLQSGRLGATSYFELRLGRNAKTEVRLFDVSGRLVRTLLRGTVSAGAHQLAWDGQTEHGERAAAGVYLLQARAGEAHADTKVILLR